jgi:small subunit ribosomal protein S16
MAMWAVLARVRLPRQEKTVAKPPCPICFAPRFSQGIPMAVSIRLSRFGRLHRPLFRVVAIDKRRHREGESNEIIGAYDPLKKDKNLELDAAKVESWVNRGAQISGGLRSLMKKYGYTVPAPGKTAAAKAPAAKAKAPAAKAKTPKKTYVAPSRRALKQHQAKQKAARKAAAAAAAPAAPAAEAPAQA